MRSFGEEKIARHCCWSSEIGLEKDLFGFLMFRMLCGLNSILGLLVPVDFSALA